MAARRAQVPGPSQMAGLYRLNLSDPNPHPHPFFSPSPPTCFFFLSFFRFRRSLFFKLWNPALHTSAYFVKKDSSSLGCTTVLNLTWFLFFTRSFDCVSPSEARTRTGRGLGGWRSQSGSSATFFVVGAEESWDTGRRVREIWR